MTRKEIGRRVRGIRKERGRSLRWLAEQTGFSKSALSRIELGEQSVDASALTTIAAALDCKAMAFYAEASR